MYFIYLFIYFWEGETQRLLPRDEGDAGDDDDGRLWSGSQDGIQLQYPRHRAWRGLPKLRQRKDRRILNERPGCV